MIIKLQGMYKDECFFYDTESVKVTKVNYNREEFRTIDWTFDLILNNRNNVDINIFDGYIFTLDNDKLLYTELDVWIDGEQING